MFYRVHFGAGAFNDYDVGQFVGLRDAGLINDDMLVETIVSVPLPDNIKAECGRRIYAVASLATQTNMTAARAAGLLTPDQDAAFLAGLQWIGAMRAACANMITSCESDHQSDAHWPACPVEFVALANAF